MLNRAAMIIIAFIAAIGMAHAHAAGSPPGEYEIKAAFLYNFANFVEWPSKTPADDSDSFIIG